MTGKDTLRSVQFQSVEIIELAYVVGDNPSVSSGVPLSIEWEAQRWSTMGLDFFENHRPPRSEQCVRMSSRSRTKLLLRSGCSQSEIEAAIEEADITRKDRFRTICQLKKMASTVSKTSASLSPIASRPKLAGQCVARVICLARNA